MTINDWTTIAVLCGHLMEFGAAVLTAVAAVITLTAARSTSGRHDPVASSETAQGGVMDAARSERSQGQTG
jgi:hypothetical protein